MRKLVPCIVAWLAFVQALPAQLSPTYNLSKEPGVANDAGDLQVLGIDASVITSMLLGDLNGDGVDDLIVAAVEADVGSPLREDAGAVYVWFGGAVLDGVRDGAGNLGAAPDLRILGGSSGDRLAEFGALALGDFNGDGVSDLVIGCSGADGPADGREGCGEVYLIFGRTSAESFPATIDLADQGSGGADVILYGEVPTASLSADAAIGVGDLNGDGISDLLLSGDAPNGPLLRPSISKVYVVFGRRSDRVFPTTLDFEAGEADLEILGSRRLGAYGTLPLGDVNGDGVEDLVIGAWGADDSSGQRDYSGAAYIIYGREAPASFPAQLDLAEQGEYGADVTIDGAAAGDNLTGGGLGLADLNGDGVSDVIIGSTEAGGVGANDDSGAVYILFGRKGGAMFPEVVDLASDMGGGADLTIHGAEATLLRFLAADDFTGDGIADLVLQSTGKIKWRGEGAVYILYGRQSFAELNASVDLGLGADSGMDVAIYGGSFGDGLGSSGCVVRDLGGDGIPDLLLGAPGAHASESGGGEDAGEAYIFYGRMAGESLPAMIDLADPDGAGPDVVIHVASYYGRLTWGGSMMAGDLSGDGVADALLDSRDRDLGTSEVFGVYGAHEGEGVPELAVYQSGMVTSELVNRAMQSFGSVPIGTSAEMVFTVRNLGAAPLQLAPAILSGSDVGEYSITVQPEASLASLGTSNLTVRFTPTRAGLKSVALTLLSNDLNEGEFVIPIRGHSNRTPTDFHLSNNVLAENVPPGSTVGTLSAIDPDIGQAHAFTLVPGEGALDNVEFAIDGDVLLFRNSPDFESKSAYRIRIRATDDGDVATSFEKPFHILIADLPRADDEGFARVYDLAKLPGSAVNAPDELVYGASEGDRLNFILVDDLDGDGFAEVMRTEYDAEVGSPPREEAGAIYLWYGAADLAAVLHSASVVETADVTIIGAGEDDRITGLVQGDVNGDGRPDLVLRTGYGDGPDGNRIDAGEILVILARAGARPFPELIDLSIQGEGGADVTIYGASAGAQLGFLGHFVLRDLNGDNLDDLLLGTPYANEMGRENAGTVSVIFGREAPATFPLTVDLALPGAADMTIVGASPGDYLDEADVGDFNADGVTDLLLQSIGAGPNEERDNAGEAYIVFGRPEPAGFPAFLDLADGDESGADVTIFGANERDFLALIRPADIDGDGITDILLRAGWGDGPAESRPACGEVYAVFGRQAPQSFPSVIDLADQGGGGADLTIFGASAGDRMSPADPEDVNGDGIADLILGSSSADGPGEGRDGAGEAYIVYGRRAPDLFPSVLDLSIEGRGGADVTIFGASAGDVLRRPRLGDLSGDGITDLVLVADRADGPRESRPSAGEAYVVFGGGELNMFPATIDLGMRGSGGADITIYGASPQDQLIRSTLVDFDADGQTDLLLGAFYADGPGEAQPEAGEAYMLYSFAKLRPTPFEAWAAANGTAADDRSLLSFAFDLPPGVHRALVYQGTSAGGGEIAATGAPITRFEPSEGGGGGSALFVRRKDYFGAGLIYVPQFSSSLIDWHDSVALPLVLADDGVNQIVSVPFPPRIGDDEARFFRVLVQLAP